MEKIREITLGNKHELPQIIEVPYPYIVIEDIPEVLRVMNKRIDKQTSLAVQEAVSLILGEAAPDGVTFITTKSTVLKCKLEREIRKELKTESTGVIQLDRYICSGWKNDNLIRLNLSRSVSGGLSSRPGTLETPEEQIERLVQWAENGNYMKILLVDDVLAFGDTLTPLIQGLKAVLPEAEIEVLVGISSSGGGWGGRERVVEETGVNVRAMSIVKAGEKNDWTSGMALPTSRDFTFFGGKVLTNTESGIQFSFPYFLPFSVPVTSFMPIESRVVISRKLMDLSVIIAQTIDAELGRRVTLGEILSRGFGVPTTRLECLMGKALEINSSTSLSDYLMGYRNIFEENIEEISRESMG